MRNIIRKTTEKGVSNYTYDKAYRLKTAVNPTLDNESYTYDKVGNRLTSASTAGNWTYNNSDQLLTTPTDAYEYTANGNTKKITPADTTQKASEYLYDARDRLAEVKKDNTTLQSNRYDFQQRRLAKTTSRGITYFLYGQTGLLAEYQSNGDFIQGYGYNPKTSYTTNPQYTITPKTGTGYDVDFYHNDHLATPQKLTNSTGAVSWAMESNAFGETTIKTQATINNLRFPGQYYDTDIKLSQNYYRDYSAELGRYVESDPIGLRGGINTLIYANSSPLINFDISGLAYFAKRPLSGLPWLGWASSNPIDDACNTEISHEHLFFEDGKEPSNVGFAKGGLFHEDNPSGYRISDSGYNDCVMRIAYPKAAVGEYKLIGNNCQDWASRVRAQYPIALASKEADKCFQCEDEK